MRKPDYGEMMADAAADGFDSPEARDTAIRHDRNQHHEQHEPDPAEPETTTPAPLHQVAIP